jgi:hypothetical protein
MFIAALAAIAAAAFAAGAVQAFPISLPGFKPKPKAEAQGPKSVPEGLYYLYQGDREIDLVDSASIGETPSGRRRADVYVLGPNGGGHRDTDDFDCQAHAFRKVVGDSFVLADDGAAVTEKPTPGFTKDYPDPNGSLIRRLEVFVCNWPASGEGQTVVSGIPDDPHERLKALSVQAKDALAQH